MQPSCTRCTSMFYPNLSNEQCDDCCALEVNEEMVACGMEPYDDGDTFGAEYAENAAFEQTDEYFGMWQEDYGGECG